MKVVATVAFSGFPYWEKCLVPLSKQVGEIYIRFDANGDKEVQQAVKDSGLLTAWMESDQPWNRWNWREDMIRMLDVVQPDVVLTPDQDETFQDNIVAEVKAFYKSDKKAMMFSYTKMPTHDGRDTGVIYPSLPHMKGYKWQKGLSYHPYHGLAQPVQYANQGNIRWQATTQIQHWCMYTPEMEKAKKAWVMKEYGMF